MNSLCALLCILLAKSKYEIIKVEELDLPEDECVTDRSYDFHKCVRQSFAAQVSDCHKRLRYICKPFIGYIHNLNAFRSFVRPFGTNGVKIWQQENIKEAVTVLQLVLN